MCSAIFLIEVLRLLQTGERKKDIDELHFPGAGARAERQRGRTVVVIALHGEGAAYVFGSKWEFKTHVVASFLVIDGNEDVVCVDV